MNMAAKKALLEGYWEKYGLYYDDQEQDADHADLADHSTSHTSPSCLLARLYQQQYPLQQGTQPSPFISHNVQCVASVALCQFKLHVMLVLNNHSACQAAPAIKLKQDLSFLQRFMLDATVMSCQPIPHTWTLLKSLMNYPTSVLQHCRSHQGSTLPSLFLATSCLASSFCSSQRMRSSRFSKAAAVASCCMHMPSVSCLLHLALQCPAQTLQCRI